MKKFLLTVSAAALVAYSVTGFTAQTYAGSLFEEDTPIEKADESLQEFDTEYGDALSGLRSDVETLKELQKMSPDEARKKAEGAMHTMRDLLVELEPGGIVEESTRGALDWMTANQELARNDQAMSSSERQEIEQLWSQQILRMTQQRSRIETLRGTLEAEIGNFEGTLSYLTHLEMIETAQAMNLAVEKLLGTMNEALGTLREQKRPEDTENPTS